MNASYDKKSAVVQLETLFADAIRTENEPPFLMDVKDSDYHARRCQNPPWWKIIERDSSMQYTEAMFRIRGVICFALLPPVKTRGKQGTKKNTKELLNLQQRVTITGLGSQSFAKCAGVLDQLVNVLANATPSVTSPLDPLIYEGHPTITFQNRYFSERKHVPSLPSLAFNRGVDDFGILAQYDAQVLIHCIENRVEYVADQQGRKEHIEPKRILPGDVVEIIFSIAGVPIKNNQIKSMLVLRGICLLDSSLQLQSQHASTNILPSLPTPSNFQVKRKLVYIGDEEQELSKRMNDHRL